MAEPTRESIAFPKLESFEIEAMRACPESDERFYQDGQALFEVGDVDFDFFVVVEGLVDIFEGASGKETLVATHEPGEFSGDVDMLTGRPAVVRAAARGRTTVLALPAKHLRRVISQVPQLSDRILRAFLMRRQILEEDGGFGVRVVGSRYSPDTHRIREFLAKNRSLFHWVDLEENDDTQAILEGLGVSLEETPVVDCANGKMLRNPSNGDLATCLGIRRPIDKSLHDLIIVGPGRQGLRRLYTARPRACGLW